MINKKGDDEEKKEEKKVTEMDGNKNGTRWWRENKSKV